MCQLIPIPLILQTAPKHLVFTCKLLVSCLHIKQIKSHFYNFLQDKTENSY